MDEGTTGGGRGVGYTLLRAGALCLSIGVVATLMVRSSTGCAGEQEVAREVDVTPSASASGGSVPAGPAAGAPSGKQEYGSTGKSWADPNLIDRVIPPAPSATNSASAKPAPSEDSTFFPGTKSGVMIKQGGSK
ncbi:MAG: hypothetical protein IPM79_31290 [Polyangiaceae bacterium]|jgi:hypothetical protein|nr:hypothetical protein [Polyangiaceae bacterium]MBK8941969.1 hypothetical protein [Polyangiaceae bacterium]